MTEKKQISTSDGRTDARSPFHSPLPNFVRRGQQANEQTIAKVCQQFDSCIVDIPSSQIYFTMLLVLKSIFIPQ